MQGRCGVRIWLYIAAGMPWEYESGRIWVQGRCRSKNLAVYGCRDDVGVRIWPYMGAGMGAWMLWEYMGARMLWGKDLAVYGCRDAAEVRIWPYMGAGTLRE